VNRKVGEEGARMGITGWTVGLNGSFFDCTGLLKSEPKRACPIFATHAECEALIAGNPMLRDTGAEPIVASSVSRNTFDANGGVLNRLARTTWVAVVHGVTGQVLEEGVLAAGTIVRDVRESREVGGDGSLETVTRFLASTDGGETWYEHRTFGRLRTNEVTS
jgi:hypothetical protein